jgi:two-component system sensor histidine kinase AdeS
MVRVADRIVTQLLFIVGLTAFITTTVGLAAYFAVSYFQLHNSVSRMPPKARAELNQLIAAHQRGSDRYYEIYDRYSGKTFRASDLGFITVIGLISTTVGGSVAVVLARRISRPIVAVAKAATQVSAGDHSVRVDKGRTFGEIGVLVDNFNSMAAQIELYERERTVLTAGIAHELRTPLTILGGRLHGLADGVIDPVTGEADRLLRQVGQLSRLVEDLRTLAHAEAGQLSLDLRRVKVDEILRAAVADLQSAASNDMVAICENYVSAEVLADPVRLTQIFNNLLTNAIKHAPGGSRVTISMAIHEGFVAISVLDEGDGIQIEDMQRLFIPFWRGGADQLLGRPGSGLGLALAAKLAQAHGGTIVAENSAGQSGARFCVSLPLSMASRPSPHHPERQS